MLHRGKYPKNFIRDLRTARGWTLRDLEDRTGWSNQTVSNLELSKADLTWSKILRLAEVFECHPLEITEGPAAESEQNLLKTYRGLQDGERRVFNHMLASLAEKSAASAPAGPEADDVPAKKTD